MKVTCVMVLHLAPKCIVYQKTTADPKTLPSHGTRSSCTTQSGGERTRTHDLHTLPRIYFESDQLQDNFNTGDRQVERSGRAIATCSHCTESILQIRKSSRHSSTADRQVERFGRASATYVWCETSPVCCADRHPTRSSRVIPVSFIRYSQPGLPEARQEVECLLVVHICK